MTVGIALAALIIGLFAWLRTDISRQGERLEKRLDDLDGQAKLEGLREAIAGRKDAA